MAYQIYDNGASIRIVSDSGEKLIMKHQVVQLSLVSGSIIKIDQGDPLTTLYLNFSDVTVPVTVSATALRDLLNAYVTSCVCSSCSNGSGSAQVAANNGLSIENNNVVLGEAVDSTLGIATLINNRQINTNGFSVKLKSGLNNSTLLSGETIKIQGAYDPAGSTGTGTPAILSLGNMLGKVRSTNIIRRNNGLYISTDAQWSPFVLQDNGKIVYGGINGESLSDTTADFNCNATAGFMKTIQHFTEDANVGDSFTGNSVFTNVGAVNPITLYLSATSIGSFFTFYVHDYMFLQIQPKSNTGTIRVATNQTSPGYPLTSDQAGSSVTLCLIAPDDWVAIAVVGTWIAQVIAD